jgi:hypothetical protein
MALITLLLPSAHLFLATLRIRPRITGSPRPPQPRAQILRRDGGIGGVFPASLRYDSFHSASVSART